mgnify:CR=1 FL=1
MNYKLCIEGESGKIDITDPNVIKKVDIKVFQSDKSANDRSDQLFNELTIYGVLTDKSQKETKEIFDWSKKTDKANVYKTVSIQVYNQQELLRDYYLKEMYCVSYEEIFNEYASNSGQDADSIGSFVLEMKQRKGAIDTIVVEC